MDAYRILRIWHLKRLSIKLRKKRGLPPIQDPDDLPDPKLDPDFVPVSNDWMAVRGTLTPSRRLYRSCQNISRRFWSISKRGLWPVK